MKGNFVELLKGLLIEENGYSLEDAEALIKKYPDIIIQGIMKGNFALRAVVIALEMKAHYASIQR